MNQQKDGVKKSFSFWSPLKWCFVVAWICALGVALYSSSKTNLDIAQKYKDAYTAPPFFDAHPNLLKIATLGHKGLLDDLALIWMINIVNEPDFKNTVDKDKFYKIAHSIAKHTPNVESFYMLTCFALSEDLKRPQMCEPIIMLGMSAFPNSWRLPMVQGFIHAFTLNDPTRAAFFFATAASRTERSPPHVAKVAQRLLNKEAISREDYLENLSLLNELPIGQKFKDMFLEKQRNLMLELQEER